MSHIIEPASSGRSKCRGCGKNIAKYTLRFGERVENPYGEGERTLWFHTTCGALKRSESYLEAAAETSENIPNGDTLLKEARLGVAHRRLCRVDGAERSPTGRARCRSCRELIEKEAWRVRLVFWDEARFSPSGFIHASCAIEHLGTSEILTRVAHFSPDLTAEDLDKVREQAERGSDL